MKKLISILTACVMAVGISGLIPVSASAAKIKPNKVKIKSVKAVSTTAAKVSWKKVKKAKGYQIKVSNNKKFKKSKVVNIKKNTSKAKIKNLKTNTKYFVKVRAYTKVGKKKVYGKWSKFKSVKTKRKKGPSPIPEATDDDWEQDDSNTDNTDYSEDDYYIEPEQPDNTQHEEPAFKSKYTYSAEVLNKYDLYTGHTVFVYVKTDFPYWGDYPDEPYTMIRDVSDEHYSVATRYSDINYLSSFCGGGPVNGGYIVQTRFDKPGKHTITIQEQTEAGVNDWCDVCSIEVDVKDYNAEKTKWAKKIISEQTNDSMSNVEKLKTLERYLGDNFKYLPNDGENLMYFITTTGADFETKRIDCIGATDYMLLFADLLGLEGKSEWAGFLNHHYAEITIDGKVYAFDPDVLPATGVITEWEYII